MQRQAVGVMRSEAVVSERRACGLVKATSGDMPVSAAKGAKIRVCGSGCASWLRAGDGLAIGGSRSC